MTLVMVKGPKPGTLCNAVLKGRNGGRPCGRIAKFLTEEGPRCGFHEPEALAARIARVRREPRRKP
jgi:hypothetical protein